MKIGFSYSESLILEENVELKINNNNIIPRGKKKAIKFISLKIF